MDKWTDGEVDRWTGGQIDVMPPEARSSRRLPRWGLESTSSC